MKWKQKRQKKRIVMLSKFKNIKKSDKKINQYIALVLVKKWLTRNIINYNTFNLNLKKKSKLQPIYFLLCII